MGSNQEDRRIRRSRRLLGDALLRLLETHALNTIKVSQVTDAADIGYMTFYRHYNNLDELLVDRVSSLIEEEVGQVVADCYGQAPVIFTHVGRYTPLYRTILFSPEAARARRMMEDALAHSYLPTTRNDAIIPAALRARTMASAALTLIAWWLEHDRAIPAERMVALYHQLVLDGHIDPVKLRALSPLA